MPKELLVLLVMMLLENVPVDPTLQDTDVINVHLDFLDSLTVNVSFFSWNFIFLVLFNTLYLNSLLV